ncbi:MAG: alpha-amylase family glycosyl hydrolase [Acidimicrobiales bacterium]
MTGPPADALGCAVAAGPEGGDARVPALGVRVVDGAFSATIWGHGAARARIVRVADGRAWELAPSHAPLALWSGRLDGLAHGDRYLVEVDRQRHPDPWARAQPDGVDGPSAAVDPAAIGAVEPGTAGRPPHPPLRPEDVVVYELHVGTFTPEGTLDAVAAKLGHLASLGVTHIELMPLASFPGERGWGYDGIAWQAVHHRYGGPEALVRLVDQAHVVGLGVIVDVVFNHVGPTGDHRYRACGPFFTDRHRTPWGDAINLDGPGSDVVRATILQAAAWWLGPIGADGLRVDACHALVDQRPRHILAELTGAVRAAHPSCYLVAESGLNDPRVVRPEAQGGWGFDADWADDLHHALRAILTGDDRGWLGDFGAVAQLAKAFHRPLVHDGTWSAYRGRHFGAPVDDVAPHRYVTFAHDHDQVGNRPFGDRLPLEVRAVALMCTLLAPSTPMLFMGDEHDEPGPFQFFTDHTDPSIAEATRQGRRDEFRDLAGPDGAEVPDPQDPATFERSKLAWRVDARSLAAERRCRDLLRLRRWMGGGEAQATFDEAACWLRVDRRRWTMVANLAPMAQEVVVPAGAVAFRTHPEVAVVAGGDEHVARLPAFGGVVVERAGT